MPFAHVRLPLGPARRSHDGGSFSLEWARLPASPTARVLPGTERFDRAHLPAGESSPPAGGPSPRETPRRNSCPGPAVYFVYRYVYDYWLRGMAGGLPAPGPAGQDGIAGGLDAGQGDRLDLERGRGQDGLDHADP